MRQYDTFSGRKNDEFIGFLRIFTVNMHAPSVLL